MTETQRDDEDDDKTIEINRTMTSFLLLLYRLVLGNNLPRSHIWKRTKRKIWPGNIDFIQTGHTPAVLTNKHVFFVNRVDASRVVCLVWRQSISSRRKVSIASRSDNESTQRPGVEIKFNDFNNMQFFVVVKL